MAAWIRDKEYIHNFAARLTSSDCQPATQQVQFITIVTRAVLRLRILSLTDIVHLLKVVSFVASWPPTQKWALEGQ